MKCTLLFSLLFALSSSVHAAVSPEIHKTCKGAKNCLGCVKAITGKGLETNKILIKANKCPEQTAYFG